MNELDQYFEISALPQPFSYETIYFHIRHSTQRRNKSKAVGKGYQICG